MSRLQLLHSSPSPAAAVLLGAKTWFGLCYTQTQGYGLSQPRHFIYLNRTNALFVLNKYTATYFVKKTIFLPWYLNFHWRFLLFYRCLALNFYFSFMSNFCDWSPFDFPLLFFNHFNCLSRNNKEQNRYTVWKPMKTSPEAAPKYGWKGCLIATPIIIPEHWTCWMRIMGDET